MNNWMENQCNSCSETLDDRLLIFSAFNRRHNIQFRNTRNQAKHKMANRKCVCIGISNVCQCYQCRRIHASSVRFQTVLINRYDRTFPLPHRINTTVRQIYTAHIGSHKLPPSCVRNGDVISHIINYGKRRNIFHK